MTASVADGLRRLPVFAQLSRRGLARADALMTRVTFLDGEVMCRQGRLGREAFILVSGTAEVTRDGQVVAQVGAGDVVGESALLGAHLRNATVTATSEVEALVMSVQEFDSILELPGVGDAIRGLHERRRAS